MWTLPVSLAVCLAGVSLLVPQEGRCDEPPAEVVEILAAYEQRVAEVRAPLFDLQEKYLAALGALAERKQAEGSLDAVLEIRNIAAQAEAGTPGDAAVVSEEAKRLQGIYVRESARLESEISEELAAARASCSAALESEVARLTREGQLEGALLARQEMERIQAEHASAEAGSQATPTSDPAQAAKERPFVNSLWMRFVPVPGTDVLFCIHETRWRDFAIYADEVPGVVPLWQDQTHDGFTITERPEDHPVVRVNWDEAKAFCDWLSEREGISYRLPTDREWSIAVGIGRYENWTSRTTPESVSKPRNQYPWGTRWPPQEGAGNFSDESRKALAPRPGATYFDGYDDGFPTTAPVMSFAPNAFGIYDMAGNVWQWCEDWWNEEQTLRVLRGASWSNTVRPENFLSGRRIRYRPESRLNNFGFRVVIDLAESQDEPGTSP